MADQEYSDAELENALRNASAKAAAGGPNAERDAADARKIADILYSRRQSKAEQTPAQAMRTPPFKSAEPGWADYLWDQAKAGVKQGAEAIGAASPARSPNVPEALRPNLPLTDIGYEGLQTQNPVKELLGAGVRSAADPTNYPPGPGSFAGKVVSAATGGMYANEGAHIGRQVPWIGEMAGGIAGGVLGSFVSAMGQALTGKAFAGLKYMFKNYEQMGPQGMAMAQQYAEHHLQTFLNQAIKDDPAIAANIARMQATANAQGVQLPITAMLENPIIKAAVMRVAKTDAKFNLEIEKQAKIAEEQLRGASQFKGAPDKAFTELGATTGKLPTIADREERIAALKNQQGVLQQRALEESKPFITPLTDPNRTKAIGDLAYDALTDVSPIGKSLYSRADALARERGVVLPPAGVESIYDYIKAEKEGALKDFPRIWSKAEKVFKPQEVDGVVKSMENGVPVFNPGKTREFSEATYQQYDELKREINNELLSLNPNNPGYKSDRRTLLELRAKVFGEADTHFDPEVLGAVKAADKQTAFDFHFRDFSRSIFDKNGAVDPRKVVKWSDENKEALHNITDAAGNPLHAKITPQSQKIAQILSEKDDLQGLIVEARKMHISEMAGVPPGELKDMLIKDPNFRNKFFSEFGHSKETLDAARSLLLDHVFSTPSPLEALRDPAVKTAFNRFFGSGELQKIEELSKLADTLSNVQRYNLSIEHSVNKDLLERKVGFSVGEVMSRFRNQLQSPQQSAIQLASKGISKKADEAFDRRLAELLLDPKNLAKALEDAKNISAGNPTTGFLRKIWDTALAEKSPLGAKVRRGFVMGVKAGLPDEDTSKTVTEENAP